MTHLDQGLCSPPEDQPRGIIRCITQVAPLPHPCIVEHFVQVAGTVIMKNDHHHIPRFQLTPQLQEPGHGRPG